MNKCYNQWIKKHVNLKACYGTCKETTLQMQKNFPELVRVHGWYVNIYFGENLEHWWLKTTKNEVIDPTQMQFQFSGIYQEFKEGSPEPKGKCINCGGYVYNSEYKYFCRDLCHTEHLAYMQKETTL